MLAAGSAAGGGGAGVGVGRPCQPSYLPPHRAASRARTRLEALARPAQGTLAVERTELPVHPRGDEVLATSDAWKGPTVEYEPRWRGGGWDVPRK